MSVFGIVSEFNPFHLGHEYLVRCARDMGADAVVCAMSGNSTQRGELSITDKYTRAEATQKCGADLVIELPFPWSSASAESFALAGIHLLSSFCDTVIFGSECGDIDLLCRVAEFTSSPEFKERYAELLTSGEQSATAYAALVGEVSSISLSSNDLLGVEYIKAAKTLGVDLRFVTVKREGSAYRCDEMSNGKFDSAMAIRAALSKGDSLEELKARLPLASYELLADARENGKIVDLDKYGNFAIMHFRLLDDKEGLSFAECEGGVLERICKTAHDSSGTEEFWNKLSTKRYTDAKLRRAVLFAMCKVSRDDIFMPSLPTYTLLLAANSRGRELLSCNRKKGEIKVVTKPADVSLLCEEKEQRQAELSARLDAIYNLCLPSSAPAGEYMKKKPYIT